MSAGADIDATVSRLKREGDSFALATVVRTLSVTAAKPGAKAIINQHGEIIEGWIGGGCARGAVRKAAMQSIETGDPCFVAIHPDDLLREQGLETGANADGKWVASNLCPSKGSMEIFVEPYLANPELIIAGASPVAASLHQLAPLFNFTVAAVRQPASDSSRAEARVYEQWAEVPVEHAHRYIVIATQGAGDFNALSAALGVQSRHIGFVGSHRKMAHLAEKLAAVPVDSNTLQRVKGPAGLDIGAVTPHEIALSILAELVQIRRSQKPGR